MNRVRFYREQRGLSLRELARRVNIMPLWLQRIEQYDWDKTPYGLEFEQKLAEALGVHVAEIFPIYAWPKREPEPQPKPDSRTPEEIDETIRQLNEARREAGKILDEHDHCHYEETYPGIWEGYGDFRIWERRQAEPSRKPSF